MKEIKEPKECKTCSVTLGSRLSCIDCVNLDNRLEWFNSIYKSKLECNRCYHKWMSRMDRDPKVCPKYKSPYWNKPRVRNL